MNNEIKPKIYVACLAAYNNGYLHGKWIDVTPDVDAVQEEIQSMLTASPVPGAEEWKIHDSEGFGGIDVGDIKTAGELTQLIEEHDEKLVAGIYNYYGSLEDTQDALENRYCGEYNSDVEYAEQLFDECYAHDIPENIRFYIDYEKFARDLFICDYISIESDSGVYIFSCN